MYCINCGNKLGKGHFCSKCGFDNSEALDIKETKEPKENNQNNSSKTVINVCKIICSLIVSYFSGIICFSLLFISIFFDGNMTIMIISRLILALLFFANIYYVAKPSNNGLTLVGILYIVLSIPAYSLFGLITGILNLVSKKYEN